MRLTRIVCAAFAVLAVLPSVQAQNMPAGIPPAGAFDIVDEIRIGAHIHEAYYTMLPLNPQDWYWDTPEDISFDVLFISPDMEVFRWLGSPRPEIGATISTTGFDSLLHFGLTWQVPVLDTPLYLEGTFGGAVHNGYLDNAPPGYRDFGCRVNFYERFGVGANLSENLTATLTYEHTSNAGLCHENSGLSNFGLRVGWKF